MRVFLAATMSGMSLKLRDDTVKKCKPLYFLETFYNGEKTCLKVMGDVGNDNFLLDSGAFSYMNGADATLEDMQSYVERYIQFIIENNIRYYFEIDVDNIFGLDMVEYWRSMIEKRVGRQCIPVWHKGRGVEYWKRMCAEYDYVAIGGLVFHVRKKEYEGIKKLISYANDRAVKVHGLGFTKTSTLHEYGWYSVDSSTWNIGAARGQQLYSFRNGSISQRKINKDGRRVDIGRLVAHNMVEWTKYQKFMEDIRV
jgi:hypothetical protein